MSNIPIPSTSSDPLSGYYGHLTEEQERSLASLKVLLAKDGIALGSLDDEAHGDRSHGVSDLELLRFMRARKFDVQRSYAMYTAALRWRKSVSLDHLYRTFDWKRAQSAARVGYPQYFHKTDRSGSPVHIHEICNVDLNKLFKLISPEEQVKYMYLLNESNFRERFPGCTEELRRQRARPINGQSATSDTDDVENPSEMEAREIREVETVTGILDIKNVGLMGFWKVKDLLGQVIQISDNYYPETSNRMYIINAPSIFSTIWSYVKNLIDARTASRIFILGSDYKEALLQHIAPENLPVFYGGSCNCEGIEFGCRNGDVGCWNDYQKGMNGSSNATIAQPAMLEGVST